MVQTTDGIAVNLGNPIIDFDFIIDIRVVGYPEVANGVPLCINVESTLYLLLVVIYNPNVITPMVIVSFYPGYPEQILLDSMFRLFAMFISASLVHAVTNDNTRIDKYSVCLMILCF